MEVAVPVAAFERIAVRIDDCDAYVAHDGKLTPATVDALRISHQTWAWERATAKWRFDVFREPHEDDVWICRRDHRIRRPYIEIIQRGPDDTPYLAPEIVLLFKAKKPREKDEADFRGALPLLDQGQRGWLDDALAVISPAHRWRAAIATQS